MQSLLRHKAFENVFFKSKLQREKQDMWPYVVMGVSNGNSMYKDPETGHTGIFKKQYVIDNDCSGEGTGQRNRVG